MKPSYTVSELLDLIADTDDPYVLHMIRAVIKDEAPLYGKDEVDTVTKALDAHLNNLFPDLR